MSRFGRKNREPPEGFEYVEPTLTALDNELREKVNEPHEGLRKNESQWPIHQINWQKSRYIYDLYYTFKRISREVYDYCISNKLVDAALIAKWKKPGYERLCSTYVINPRNYNYGTVSICRVPSHALAPGTVIEDPTTGCRGCASGSSGNIFGNKYGQYLAAIQVAREERARVKMEQRRRIVEAQRQHQLQAKKQQSASLEVKNKGKETVESEEEIDSDAVEESGDEDENDRERASCRAKESNTGVVGAPDGSSGVKNKGIWANGSEQERLELSAEMIGQLAPEARREAMAAMAKNKHLGTMGGGATGGAAPTGPPGKRTRY